MTPKLFQRSSRSTRLRLLLAPAALVGAVAACNPTPATTTLSSLRGGSAMSLVCLGWDGEGTQFTLGHSLADCPDTENASVSNARYDARRLFGLLTQPETGEVAVIDMYDAHVVRPLGAQRRDPVVTDLERGIPAFNFLPVGAEPEDIASTPGGVATIVGVRENGRPGLFVLPSSCIGQREEGEPLRDITLWPSCRLEAAPGAMAVYVDPSAQNVAATNDDTACPANLAEEVLPIGRRVLVVAIPERGELLTFDVQALLNVEPGSFAACEPLGRLDLNGVQIPSDPPAQVIPQDLGPSFQDCLPRPKARGPRAETFDSRPSDIALSRDVAYVSDLSAPVIHRVDLSDPASPVLSPPLYPTSVLEPNAVVTTRKVAVSPTTFGGRQYAYAIDASVEVGSLMAFEVGALDSPSTPIVRARSPKNPDSPPDRIGFGQEVADIDFARGDRPRVDPDTGVGIDGVSCDPDPSEETPGARYRPTSAGTGAAPTRLRGTALFAALYSGQVALVDIEDLDAPCRRPAHVNTTSQVNFRGCAPDPYTSDLMLDDQATVTDELSCNVVVPHWPRAASMFRNASASLAISLRQYPRLQSAVGRALQTDQTTEGRNSPKLLGVEYETRAAGDYPDLWVGAARVSADPSDAADDLVLDPSLAVRNSVTLSYDEPRAFRPNASFNLEYEGALGLPRSGELDAADGQLRLTSGANPAFCGAGVQDTDAARIFGERFLAEDRPERETELDEFALGHGDRLVILSDPPPEDSPYWATGDDPAVPEGAGNACGRSVVADLPGQLACQRYFGSSRVEPLLAARSLRISEAYDDQLLLEADAALTPGERESHQALIQCCFPETISYEIRAAKQWVIRSSGTAFRHDMRVASACDGTASCGCTEDGAPRCIHDESPLRRDLTSRTIEIACSENCPNVADGLPAIGRIDPDELPLCVVDDPRQVAEGAVAPECVYRGLASAFAVYRGRAPSVAGMSFRWQFTGGFGIAAANLGAITSTPVVPTSIEFVQEIGQMIVTDGSRNGVNFLPFDFLDRSNLRAAPYSVLSTQRTPHELPLE